MSKYIVAPTGYPWTVFDTAEDAVEAAKGRIEKNQRCYAGSRQNHEYAICKIEAYVRPIRPIVDVEVVEEKS